METEQPLPRTFGHLPLYATILMLTFAGVSALTGHWLSALFSAAFGTLAMFYHLFYHTRQNEPARWLLRLNSVLLLLVTWLVMTGWLDPLLSWLFLLPLLAFVSWPLPIATGIVVAFLALLVFGLPSAELGPARHQLLPMLTLTVLLTTIFVVLREYKAAQLAPLRRTDALTLASSHDTLTSDLHKEIRRSEREGTALAVIQLTLDEEADESQKLPSADRNALIRRIGRMLHQNLRDFDSYYRIDDAVFFILLPVTDTSRAARTAEHLRRQATELMEHHQIKMTLSAGVAGLNVGDDAESLEQKARDALKRARSTGGNRVQSYINRGY